MEREWNAIDKSVCQGLIESMPRHVAAMLKAKGGYTKYEFTALLYFLIVGNKTVPMIVLYVSCDCTTKNGSHTKWLCNPHNVMLEHIM